MTLTQLWIVLKERFASFKRRMRKRKPKRARDHQTTDVKKRGSRR